MKCRICKNKDLIKIGSLGKIAISDFTDKPSEGTKYPLELVYCYKCSLLQLSKNPPRDKMYSNYWYKSALNPVIVNDLKEISRYVKGSRVCDIGANDGTLLSFLPSNYTRFAVDPSNIKPDGFTWIKNYWEEADLNGIKFDTITAIAVLYDLPNPNKFMKKVKKHLSKDGIFISQLMTLQPMIDNNDVGNIVHEHIQYYSYKSLVTLFEQNGLEIYEVQKNNINGGSYRLFARHYQDGSFEFKEKEYDIKELKDFFNRIEVNKFRFINWIVNKKPNFVGYGASTKANTILQFYEIDLPLIDINPSKLGKYPITGHYPIINKIPKNCEYLWVFPYGFLDYFRKKERSYKGKWVTTIPEFKIYE